MRRVRGKPILVVAMLLAALWTTMCIRGVSRSLPAGISYSGDEHRGVPVEFLYDLTYQSDTGRVVEQAIFDRVFRMIDRAERFIVVDMFLFNGEHGGDREYLPLAGRLSDRIEPRIVASLGMGLSAAGLLLFTFIGGDTSIGYIVAGLLVARRQSASS